MSRKEVDKIVVQLMYKEGVLTAKEYSMFTSKDIKPM